MLSPPITSRCELCSGTLLMPFFFLFSFFFFPLFLINLNSVKTSRSTWPGSHSPPAARKKRSKGNRGRLSLQMKRNNRFTLTCQISTLFLFFFSPGECLCSLTLEGQQRVVWIVPAHPIVIQLFFFFLAVIKRQCCSLLWLMLKDSFWAWAASC